MTDEYKPMSLPEPVKMTVNVYIDKVRQMSLDGSLLIGNGPVIGRSEFEFDDEMKVGLICQDYDNGSIWIESPGVGVAMIKIGDLTHQMLHVLAGDGHCLCLPEYVTGNDES